MSSGDNLGAAIAANGMGKRYVCPTVGSVSITSDVNINGEIYIVSSGSAKATILCSGTAYNAFKGNSNSFIELENINISGAKRNPNISTVDSGRALKPVGGCRVTNCIFHGNANQGIGAGGGDSFVEDSVFYNNGIDTYFVSSGSGRSACDIKFGYGGGNLTVYNSYFHDSPWQALWFDYNSGAFDTRNCTITNHGGAGIHMEKSSGPFVVDNCIIQDNNTRTDIPSTANSGGIQINGSKSFTIQHNVFGGNKQGNIFVAVSVINDTRPGGYTPVGNITYNTLNGDIIKGANNFAGVVSSPNNVSSPSSTKTKIFSINVDLKKTKTKTSSLDVLKSSGNTKYKQSNIESLLSSPTHYFQHRIDSYLYDAAVEPPVSGDTTVDTLVQTNFYRLREVPDTSLSIDHGGAISEKFLSGIEHNAVLTNMRALNSSLRNVRAKLTTGPLSPASLGRTGGGTNPPRKPPHRTYLERDLAIWADVQRFQFGAPVTLGSGDSRPSWTGFRYDFPTNANGDYFHDDFQPAAVIQFYNSLDLNTYPKLALVLTRIATNWLKFDVHQLESGDFVNNPDHFWISILVVGKKGDYFPEITQQLITPNTYSDIEPLDGEVL